MYLKVPAAVYFDDYPMFSPESSAHEADMLVSDFLDLLGWHHDRTGPTGKTFAPSFDVLGLTLDLTGLRNDRSVILRNKGGRVEKIASKIAKVKDSGVMSLSDAQEIHGLLNFATGCFAGRSLKYAWTATCPSCKTKAGVVRSFSDLTASSPGRSQ